MDLYPGWAFQLDNVFYAKMLTATTLLAEIISQHSKLRQFKTGH
jgi:hypothetical protein